MKKDNICHILRSTIGWSKQMKDLLKYMGFSPKNNEKGLYIKRYCRQKEYTIEINLDNKKINYGKRLDSKSITIHTTKGENLVALECMNRLLEKGYKPEYITIEKTYPTGHRTSGRLDILVKKGGEAYLMIECKSWGQFEKAQKKLKKDGGQLFTYFQQDTNAEYLMLYTSRFDKRKIVYKNDIIKIEEDYRQASNVKELYERWNKLPKTNGIFEDESKAYNFKSKALTKKDLKVINQEDSSFIFHRFLSILRKHVVSDKPNAFNKIFTLFLCKIIDENREDRGELALQWLEEDDDISFMKRLTDLYKKSMKELLEKDITDIGDKDFNKKFENLEQDTKKELLKLFTNIRLKKNNEFAFKEVFDDESFKENTKVVKDIVELLQTYQLRYNKKQQYLSDFFELLLTTGLKQESGQFFTPVPIARYIIKSLPIEEITKEKYKEKNAEDLLPCIIDYAAGSGHFITESMDEVQHIINNTDEKTVTEKLSNKISSWKSDPFSWASTYIYGIEKDYRLVKTAKVSCFLHGDGLAKVIHGDGLGSFSHDTPYYRNCKKLTTKIEKDNKQFDIVVANPPYSVDAFKGSLNERKAKKDFDLFDKLTDQSSEIEALFVERTKQLLKDGGVAGIILPSSMLSNSGIYTSAREIILKYFEIVGITELGSGTFMATGTNTIVLFLRRKTNDAWQIIKNSINKFFKSFKDITANRIENIFSIYISHVWNSINIDDYISLCKKEPNKSIIEHEIYQSYCKKLKNSNKSKLCEKVIEIEKEKLLYFILAYNKKVVLTKTGDKKVAKQFLGYEFSNRRGYEGIRSIQRDKSIDECTWLFDPKKKKNPKKANYYIHQSFISEEPITVDKSLKKNISIVRLVEMMTFDRVVFDKTINPNASKKVNIVSKFPTETLDNLVTFQSGLWKGKKGKMQLVKVLRNTNFKLNNGKLSYENVAEIEVEVHQLVSRKLEFGDIILEKSGGSDNQAIGRVAIFDRKEGDTYSYSNFCSKIRVKDKSKLNPIYLWLVLNNFYNNKGTISLQSGIRLLNIDLTGYRKIKIPLPPKDIQEKMIQEFEQSDKKEEEKKSKIEKLNKRLNKLLKIQIF